MKRKISLILSVVLILSSLVANVSARNAAFTDEIVNAEVWKLIAAGAATDRPNYTTTINGVAIPFEEYPIGSRFPKTYSGKHGSGENCHAFALYAIEKIWGADCVKTPVSISLEDGAAAKKFIGTLRPGTLIKIPAPHQHSMIYLGTDSTGVIVYHSNWSPNNAVSISHFTWDSFASTFVEVQRLYTPHDIEWTSITSKTHKGSCSNCGLSVSGRHMAEVAGMGTCMTCGYYGNMDGILKVDETVER